MYATLLLCTHECANFVVLLQRKVASRIGAALVPYRKNPHTSSQRHFTNIITNHKHLIRPKHRYYSQIIKINLYISINSNYLALNHDKSDIFMKIN